MAEKITNKLKFCIHDLCYRNRIVFQIGALQITSLRDVTPPLPSSSLLSPIPPPAFPGQTYAQQSRQCCSLLHG